MNKKITNIIAALLMSGWVGVANASLIFDFSFTNSSNGGGIVTGEILGLLDNATGAATSVRVLTNSLGFGIGEYGSYPSLNTFTVDSGVLISFDFLSFGVNNSFTSPLDGSIRLTFTPSFPSGIAGLGVDGSSVIHASFFNSGFAVVQRSVPEPSSIILLSLGIAGLLVSRHRKQS